MNKGILHEASWNLESSTSYFNTPSKRFIRTSFYVGSTKFVPVLFSFELRDTEREINHLMRMVQSSRYAYAAVFSVAAALMASAQPPPGSIMGPPPITPIVSDTTLEADSGPLVVAADDVSIDCAGYAITPSSAGFAFVPGIDMSNKKGITIRNCNVSGFLYGIRADASSVELHDVSVNSNTVNGLELVRGTNALITGAFQANHNTVFGISALTSVTLTLQDATVEAHHNGLGVSITLSSTLFLNAFQDAMLGPSTLTAVNNTDGFGVTITSNSHLLLFGAARLETRENGSNGLTCFSQSEIELDRNAVIVSTNNTLNGLLIEDASMNMFTMEGSANTPYLELTNNGRDGLSLGKAAVFDTNADATTVIRGNGRFGIALDMNSIGSFANTMVDGSDGEAAVVVTFGSQADFRNGNDIGEKIQCDATSRRLVRGASCCRKGFLGYCR